MRAVRETNLCRISVHLDERTGRVIAFGAIDNLWKGAASQAVQNLNLMFGAPGGGGDQLSFFTTRWVPCPGHVTELGGGGCRPASGPPASPPASSRPGLPTSA